MRFDPTGERQRIRKEARRFTQENIISRAIELNQTEEHPTAILETASDDYGGLQTQRSD